MLTADVSEKETSEAMMCSARLAWMIGTNAATRLEIGTMWNGSQDMMVTIGYDGSGRGGVGMNN